MNEELPTIPVNNKDRYFKGQQINENYICFMRHHWIHLFREYIYFIIFALIAIYALLNIEIIQNVLRGNRELKMLFLTAFLIGTFFMHRFFIKILNYFVDVAIITDMRFVDHQKSLFFKDNMDSVDMGQIQNIERIGEGVLPELFGYGDIKIYLTASAGVKIYCFVPNVKFHYRCIARQKEARQYILTERHQSTLLPTGANTQVNPTEQIQTSQNTVDIRNHSSINTKIDSPFMFIPNGGKPIPLEDEMPK
ncbi:hypothetical protein A3B60_00820 [Candidatus Peregrinibacteria bacterium RIFCSPLOWO2_01_FULL_39_12]|nr:MAG: hypothetical protein A3B60_00820 [Candidatus Peregrinibacteria bacterium RIFCSPLOWO2_01_FULL_39_12]OGJ42695.1 MAG: hypothetical protein A3I58_00285 [Candidatus Peregrinibacteria bacterium RIFCSPLOWO2_02_FULL_39_10]